MAEHKHGSMDITEQENMFAAFMNFTTKTVIFLLVLLVLMAIFLI